jgi:hypothetical protein
VIAFAHSFTPLTRHTLLWFFDTFYITVHCLSVQHHLDQRKNGGTSCAVVETFTPGVAKLMSWNETDLMENLNPGLLINALF